VQRAAAGIPLPARGARGNKPYRLLASESGKRDPALSRERGDGREVTRYGVLSFVALLPAGGEKVANGRMRGCAMEQ
jgi:hypothetical protein